MKPIWAEGILLSQQHLQQWDSFWQDQQQVWMQTFAPEHWGLRSLSFDHESLRYGKFRLTQCQAVFPNGLFVKIENNAAETLSCELDAAIKNPIDIVLAVPDNGMVKGINGYPEIDNNSKATWHAVYQVVADHYDITRQHEVMLAKPDIALFCGQPNDEDYQTLTIARVLYQGDKHYSVDENFIPSVTLLSASTKLIQIVNQLLESIQAKIQILIQLDNQSAGEASIFGYNHLENFLLLQLLVSIMPRLQDWQQSPQVHPHQLFLLLSELAAKLMTFKPDFTLAALPCYQHYQLTEVFNPMATLLRDLLEDIMPTRSSKVTLCRKSDSLYIANNIDINLLQHQHFYLAVYHIADSQFWVNEFVRQIKIGAKTVIDEILVSALPGVKLSHVLRPPNKLMVKSGYEYFYLAPSGKCWEQIQQDRSIAIFIPQSFRQIQLEFITVQD